MRKTIAFVLLVTCTAPAAAITWVEIAEDGITCLTYASAAERAQIDAPLLPRPLPGALYAAYFSAPAKNDVHDRLRYLTALAALAYSADRTNDQPLRMQLLTTLAHYAQRYADAGQGAVFGQISRCTRAAIVSSAIERDEPNIAILMAYDLAERYRAAPLGEAVEDWPLLRAMREISLSNETRQGLGYLMAVATERAAAVEGAERERSSRLYGAVARAYLSIGEAASADAAAGRALSLVLPQATPESVAALLPAIYDVWLTRHGAAKAAELTNALTAKFPIPSGLLDPETEFEAHLRLAYVAQASAEFEKSGKEMIAANQALMSSRTLSIPYLRAGFDALATYEHTATDPITNMTGHESWSTLVRADKNQAKQDYLSAYRAQYEKVLELSQHTFVADARDQLNAERKIDNILGTYDVLREALPEYRAEIEDRSFRLAQLLSYGRLTLATVSAGLDSFGGDERTRFDIERFFTYSTQNSVWLRGVWSQMLGSDGDTLPTPKKLWEAMGFLDVQFEETAKSFDKYIAFIREKAPELGALITPRPLSVVEAQGVLSPGQVLVASLVTRRVTYVFAITTDKVLLTRTEMPSADVRTLVRRLRESLVASSAGGRVTLPPFDAAAAHALYKLTFGMVAPLLEGASHVIWYGHDALGSVPPAVLVTEPTAGKLSSAEELSSAKFFGDKYPVSVLADLSLLRAEQTNVRPLQQAQAFLGVGAPQLSEAELQGEETAGTVFDFARGLDAGSLADLPRLPESADELRALADTFGADRSALLLGADANRTRLDASSLAQYRVIAFATHGFKPGEISGVDEPALLLAPPGDNVDPLEGLLISRQIASLDLNADLVILSACNSANGDGRPRTEAFTGLAQAFFTAGARSLLVTHWPVISSAATRLSVAVAEGMTQHKLALDVSLQRAVAGLREKGRESAIEAHPAYWGPFVAVGEGSYALTGR